MRLIRHHAASAGLSVVLLGSAGLGLGVLTTAFAGPALAEAANSPGGNATASADPSTATPGSEVTFQVFCASQMASTATLFGTTLGLPERIPTDKQSAAGAFSVTVTLPGNIQPGTYTPSMDCDDGSSGTATLTVTALPARGGAETGDGTTSTQTNAGLAVGGLALIGVGAVTGGVAMSRRNAAARRP